MDIDSNFQLLKAAVYWTAKDASEILPLCYGDTLSALAIPADTDDGGIFPAVMIDRLNWVYALNVAPVPATPRPQIYKNDTAQVDDPLVYTWWPSLDYFGIGLPISAIQFHTDPGGPQAISWRGYGTADPMTGLLIQNPVLAVYDAFTRFGGWTLNDFDLALGAETYRTLDELGAQIRWVFQQEKPFREWLVEIFRCYHTDVFTTEAGQVAIALDRGMLGLPVYTPFRVDAQTDLDGSEDDVEFEVDEQNICNTLTVKRRLKWTNLEYTDTPTVEYARSTGLYNAIIADEVTLPAVYTDAHGLLWVNAFFARYGYLPAIVRFTVRGLSLLSATPGYYLGFTWPFFGWTEPRLLKVLNQEVLPDEYPSIRFECFDCQRTVTDVVTLPTVTIAAARTRPVESIPVIDLVPPGAASNLTATGSYRRIVLRWTPPADADYDHTEIWVSVTNDRATATFIRNGGYRGTACEESFDVADGATGYVWLMTVDTSGNGANGGSGLTGGNWYPASAVAGVMATAALVPTAGLVEASVTFTYSTSAQTTPGGYTGETVVAQAYLGDTNPQGDVIAFANVPLFLTTGQTALLRIRRGTVNGPVIGVNYVSNTTSVSITARVDCWGLDFSPDWTGTYYVTVDVVNTSGVQVAFTLLDVAQLFLRHTKR